MLPLAFAVPVAVWRAGQRRGERKCYIVSHTSCLLDTVGLCHAVLYYPIPREAVHNANALMGAKSGSLRTRCGGP